jgi:hypothetical protein
LDVRRGEGIGVRPDRRECQRRVGGAEIDSNNVCRFHWHLLDFRGSVLPGAGRRAALKQHVEETAEYKKDTSQRLGTWIQDSVSAAPPAP